MSRKMRVTLSLSKELERRLLSYGAVVAAGLITSATPAHAAIVYTASSAPLVEGNDILPLDLDNDSNPDFVFALSNCGSCTSLGIFSFGPYNAIMARYQGGYYPDAFALNDGDSIGPAGPWEPFGANLGSGYGSYSYTDYYGGTTVYPGLLLGDFINRDQPGFLGLQFDISGATHYGWARVRVFTDTTDSLAPKLSMRLIDYAYEDIADQSIAAGTGQSVPEPGSLGLLASGVLGLAAWRKRKAA
jgi:hypothetical protein